MLRNNLFGIEIFVYLSKIIVFQESKLVGGANTVCLYDTGKGVIVFLVLLIITDF